MASSHRVYGVCLVWAGLVGCGEGAKSVDRMAAASGYCGRAMICRPAEGVSNPSTADDLHECISGFFDDDELAASSGKLEALDGVAGCIEKAASCDAFAACEAKFRATPGVAPALAGQVCGDEGDESVSCDGDVMLWCFGGEYGTPHNIPFDCAARGHVCDPSVGACVDPGGAACDVEAADRCDGDRLIVCHRGKTLTLDCGALSAAHTCVENGDGGDFRCSLRADAPGCPPPGSGQNVSGCDGSVLFSCRDGGRFSFDCADFQGYVCVPGETDNMPARCAKP